MGGSNIVESQNLARLKFWAVEFFKKIYCTVLEIYIPIFQSYLMLVKVNAREALYRRSTVTKVKEGEHHASSDTHLDQEL